VARGELLGAAAGLAVDQGIARVQLELHAFDRAEYRARTGENLGGALGAVAGTALGAALGSSVSPGLGTSLGALAGGAVGGYAGKACGRALATMGPEGADTGNAPQDEEAPGDEHEAWGVILSLHALAA